jgi:cell division protein FtsA
MATGELITVADVGTSKVTVLCGTMLEGGEVQVLGMGQQASEGLRKGQLLNPEALAGCIRDALEEVEAQVQADLRDVVVGMSLGPQRGVNACETVPLPTGLVRDEDVNQARTRLYETMAQDGRVVVHALVQHFAVDRREFPRSPIGERGHRLSLRAHVVTAHPMLIDRMMEVSQRCDRRLVGLVSQPVATSLSVLEPLQSREGVVVVDIGASSTDALMWCDGALVHSATFAYGGDRLATALAVALGIDRREANLVLRRSGAVRLAPAEQRMVAEYRSGDDRMERCTRQELVEILRPRLEEILTSVHQEMHGRQLVEHAHAGWVITGGAMQLRGAVDVAKQVLGAKVQLGLPRGVTGLAESIRRPSHAAAVGLLRFVASGRGDDLIYPLRRQSRLQQMVELAQDWMTRLL